MIKREPYIDIVIGPQAYHKINDKIEEFLSKQKKIDETEFDAITKFDYLDNIKNSSKKISSFLTIQEGCDKFCHFCVVPFTRGPEYSRPFKKILEEAENLSENGVLEAKEAAKVLKKNDIEINHVYTSVLRRSIQTAELMNNYFVNIKASLNNKKLFFCIFFFRNF